MNGDNNRMKDEFEGWGKKFYVLNECDLGEKKLLGDINEWVGLGPLEIPNWMRMMIYEYEFSWNSVCFRYTI